jgi:ABC-2 type transport system permease protein
MRVGALVIRIIRQFMHDKRTLALMIIAPLLILWLISMVFNGQEYHPHIGIVDLPDPIVTLMEDQDAKTTVFANREEAERALEKNEIDAYLALEGHQPSLRLEGSDPSVNKSIILLMQKVFEKAIPAAEMIRPKITYLHGSEDMSAFDNFGPVLIGYFAFFFVFLIAGVAFLRERTGGTLERLLVTPLRRAEIVIGYIIGFGIFTMIQATLIAWFSIEILDIMMVGSFWYVLLITLLLSMTALTLGTFLSAYANNEFQMIQFIPLVIVPQVFFSGLFNMETMNIWLQKLSIIMPLTYGAEALRDIMIRGKGWSDIAVDVYVLLAFSIFFMVANVLALRKHRKI